jgi:hypothetical protein
MAYVTRSLSRNGVLVSVISRKAGSEAMLLRLRQRLGKQLDRNTRYSSLIFVACIVFGVALIADIQQPSDGAWYWYSSLFLNGKRLYGDMHLALQPLFVLETSAFMAILGGGWLLSKIPGVLHLLAYCLALLLLVRQSKSSDAQKALVLAFAFFLSISFEAYRFDDYHVLADCFQLYSLVLLLALPDHNVRGILMRASILGVLSGLAITTRLNDGAALFIGVALAILVLVPSRKLDSIALFLLATALTVVLVVHLTGDSLYDYATYSIFRAAGSKGGAGGVLSAPLHLPINALVWLRDHANRPMMFFAITVAFAWGVWISPLKKKGPWEQFALAVIAFLVLVLALDRLYYMFQSVYAEYTFLGDLTAAGVCAVYGFGIWAFVRLLWFALQPNRTPQWDHREILLLIPLGQLASASMSSGGTHMGLFAPPTILCVLLFVCDPCWLAGQRVGSFFSALSVFALCCAISYRVERPFAWHVYVEPPLFTGRVLYHHPEYGPMIIDRELLQMIQPVCQTIQAGGSEDDLLSLPLPYANYFCDLPPWHGYVQTFFDTSSKETIQSLMDDLEHAPPKWIFYQRQLATLALHEQQYNHNQPLQQRFLDQLIEQKIAQGSWRVAYSSSYGDTPALDNQWILIQTH